MKTLFVIWGLFLATPSFCETIIINSKLALHDEDARFGGLSGIDVQGEGAMFFAVSDKGTIWRGRLERDEQGQIIDVVDLEVRSILTSKGEPVEEYNIDAEEIDHDEKGNLYISFESNSRVSRFAKWDAPATLIPNAEDFAGFGYNSGPEAMCIGEDGEIWLSPERSGALERPFPIYAYDGQGWDVDLHISRRAPYLLVGMDYDAKAKRLYILERDVRLGILFHTRIRAFDVTNSGLKNEAMLWESVPENGNLEGISYFEREGRRFLMLISDDNFLPLLNTNLLELELLS